MIFIERLLDLLKENGIPRKKMLDDLGLANGSFVNWQTRGSIPNAEKFSRPFSQTMNGWKRLPIPES